jgi:hypothetical protein
MQIKNNLDVNIDLMFGGYISIEDKFKVHQFKISEIRNTIKFSNYYQYINTICIDKLNIKIALNTLKDINPYDFIIANCHHDQVGNFRNLVCDGLSLFLGESVFYDKNVAKLYTDNNLIGQLDFEDISNAIRTVNCMGEEEIISIQNEAHLQYYIDSRIAKAKFSKGNENDLSDIISSVCSKHPTISLYNVEELTLYQLMDTYKRLNAIDQYFINIKSLIAGADKKDINLKHWSEKI